MSINPNSYIDQNNHDGRFYVGEGVVVEHAQYGKENTILVAPVSQLPNMRGRLEINPEEYYSRGVDADGRRYNIKQQSTSAVTAMYWSDDPNRLTPPQVMKGERVMLFQMNGEHTYYYKPLNKDGNKRIQETVVFGYTAKKADDVMKNTPSTGENTYTETVDGANGLWEFKMTKANGEKSPWMIQMNAKLGIMTITNQDGIVVELDTNQDQLLLINQLETKVEIIQDTINLYAPNAINLESGKTINFKTNEFNLEANKVNWKVGSEINFECPTINLVGQVNAGGLNVGAVGGGSGNAEVKGNMNVKGKQDVSGSMSVGGSLSASGTVNFSAGGSSGPIRGSGD